MTIRFFTEINRNDWEYILQHAKTANIFHTVQYFDIQQADGHDVVTACAYDGDQPLALIGGTVTNAGYHRGLTEVGTKSGGWPVMIDSYEEKGDAEQIKNDLSAYFYDRFLRGKRFFFYPCFRMKNSMFENPELGCTKQYDHTVLLDLSRGGQALWAGLNQKCRNVIRYAQRKDVTARIVNKETHLEQFYAYYKSLRESLKTGYMSYAEIQRRFHVLTEKGMADLWVAFSGEKPLAYAFIWKYGLYVNFVYGSSDPETLSLKPNNLLQWELISHYQAQGYRTYNMWGVRNMNFEENSPREDNEKIEGYGKFKLSFGSELKEIVRYFRI